MTRRIALAAVLSLSLAWSCARTQPPADTFHATESEAPASVAPDVNAQNRLNAFMYVAVLPKLHPCWKKLQGEGAVTFKYTYKRTGTNWAWGSHEVESGTIPRDQQAVALQCMNDAARETAFPMEASEAARRSEEMNIHWEWPVPFPSDLTTLGRMIDGGGGGGRECSKTCVTCDCPFKPGLGVVCSCGSACSGYTAPCVLDPNQKGCTMRLPKCATGRMGGFGGGVIAFKQ
jgi:hypothetical protein